MTSEISLGDEALVAIAACERTVTGVGSRVLREAFRSRVGFAAFRATERQLFAILGFFSRHLRECIFL